MGNDLGNRCFLIEAFYVPFIEALPQFGAFWEFSSIEEKMVMYIKMRDCKMNIIGKSIKFGYKWWLQTSHGGFPYYSILYQDVKHEEMESLTIGSLPSISQNPIHKISKRIKEKYTMLKKKQS